MTVIIGSRSIDLELTYTVNIICYFLQLTTATITLNKRINNASLMIASHYAAKWLLQVCHIIIFSIRKPVYNIQYSIWISNFNFEYIFSAYFLSYFVFGLYSAQYFFYICWRGLGGWEVAGVLQGGISVQNLGYIYCMWTDENQ